VAGKGEGEAVKAAVTAAASGGGDCRTIGTECSELAVDEIRLTVSLEVIAMRTFCVSESNSDSDSNFIVLANLIPLLRLAASRLASNSEMRELVELERAALRAFLRRFNPCIKVKLTNVHKGQK